MPQETRANGVPGFMDSDPHILVVSATERREQAVVPVALVIEAAAEIGHQSDPDSGLRLGEKGR